MAVPLRARRYQSHASKSDHRDSRDRQCVRVERGPDGPKRTHCGLEQAPGVLCSRHGHTPRRRSWTHSRLQGDQLVVGELQRWVLQRGRALSYCRVTREGNRDGTREGDAMLERLDALLAHLTMMVTTP